MLCLKMPTLEEQHFIAGSSITYEFNVFDGETGLEVDLNGFTIMWYLCVYGEPNNIVVQKQGIWDHLNVFRVQLDPQDTRDLDGLYTQQPLLIDPNGNEFRPTQGLINIEAALNGAVANIINI